MVNWNFIKTSGPKFYSGDIAVSENTVNKLLNTSDDDDDNGLWQAYTNSKHLWDQNIVNGEYIIAYEFDPYLHQKLKSMLPKVRLRFKKQYLWLSILKAMEKIEEVTCIKFENRTENHHKERF